MDEGKLTDNLKREIDNLPYEEMFRLRRFAPVGHPYFIGDTGMYFLESMNRKDPGSAERVRISKKIGW